MRLSLLLALVLCVSAEAAGLSTRVSQIDAARFPVVSLILGVFSEAGAPVPGMTKDDFRLDEDGQQVKVLSVDIEKAPLNIALVLDTSGSMQPAMAALKAAVSDFLKDLDPSDRVMLITFSDKPVVKEDLTTNRSNLLEIVERLEPDGATALWDATQEGILGLKKVDGRRLAVIFTDGKDQNQAGSAPQSSHTVKDVAKLSRRLQVPLWTIALGKAVDAQLLEKLSAATGGRSYNPAQAVELRSAFGDVLTNVRLQYRLTYETPKSARDGSRRALQVTSGAKGTSGQGRGFYLAPGTLSEPPPVAAASPQPETPAKLQGAPQADSADLGELLDDSSTTVTGGGGVNVGVGTGIDVTGAGGNIHVGSGGVNLSGPGGSINVGAGGVIRGPGGNVNIGPGGISVQQGGSRNVTIDGGGIHVQQGGQSVDIGAGAGGLSVDTPDANVNIGPGGVDVKTDDASVEVGPGGVDVKTDEDSVEVSPGQDGE